MRAFLLASAVCASLVCTVAASAHAQDSTAAERPWYDRLSIRGYAQFRYNRLLETNEKLKCSTCDRSIGDKGGFFLRRARLVVTGRVNDRVSVSIQPDFATDLGGRENALVLRHYYADIYFDSAKTFRARIGQSEVPTGFEAIQSSSRRAPLDRADAMESATPGEQDLGVFLLWAPGSLKKRLRDLQTSALKGTGDYGIIAVGAYNGQGGNRAEANDAPHVIARVAYPFRLGKQDVEVEAYGYTGTYTIANGQRAAGVAGEDDFDDHRVGGALIVYPEPIGIQAEWSVGRGPEYDAPTNSILDRPVRGGYAMLSYSIAGSREQRLMAFTRAQYFNGAFKTDPDARSSVVHEYEPGVEWAVYDGLELTAAYTFSDRFYRDSASPDNHQRGRFLRLQAQVSF
ncbi:MAG TPA: porin [Gemmatimonadaceae bacterium]|nr:porin [Gemmatimonadaceae bacterium]